MSRPKGSKNQKDRRILEDALGEEQTIPELRRARKQYKRLIKRMLYGDKGTSKG